MKQLRIFSIRDEQRVILRHLKEQLKAKEARRKADWGETESDWDAYKREISRKKVERHFVQRSTRK